jgi:signal transduction histidine kinase
MKPYKLNIYFYLAIGLIIGLIIPLGFITLDLYELEMFANFKNIAWIINGQLIHKFSIIAFPIIFMVIFMQIYLNIEQKFQLKNSHKYVQSSNALLSLIAKNEPIDEVLKEVLRMIEAELPNSLIVFFYYNFSKNELDQHIKGPRVVAGSLSIPSSIKKNQNSIFFESVESQKTFKVPNLQAYDEDFLERDDFLNLGIHSLVNYPIVSNDDKEHLYGQISILSKEEEISNSINPLLINHALEVARLALNKLYKNRELKWAKAQAGHSSHLAALGEMAGGMAHEINNPLTVLSLHSSCIRKFIIKEKPDIEKLNYILDKMDKSIYKIVDIIQGMMSLSKDPNNEPQQKILADDLISDTLKLISERLVNHNIDINYDNRAFLQNHIKCQKNVMTQVILSLITNAYEELGNSRQDKGYNAAPDWIEVSGEVSGGNLIIKIIDSGRGIPKDVMYKIFEPFYTTKKEGNGTGLGLSMAQQMVHRNDGDLYIDPGSVFTSFNIKLPLHDKVS